MEALPDDQPQGQKTIGCGRSKEALRPLTGPDGGGAVQIQLGLGPWITAQLFFEGEPPRRPPAAGFLFHQTARIMLQGLAENRPEIVLGDVIDSPFEEAVQIDVIVEAGNAVAIGGNVGLRYMTYGAAAGR